MGLALRGSASTSSAGRGYNTFRPSPITDLNGDNRIDEWDEAVLLAQKCDHSKWVLDLAATRHANFDWWLGVLLVVTNALTTASGVSTAAASMNGPPLFMAVPLATAGLSAFAGLLAGLQRTLQPAEKAAQCRAAGREFEQLAETLRSTATMDSSRRPQDSEKFLKAIIQSMHDLAAPDAVADALARFA